MRQMSFGKRRLARYLPVAPAGIAGSVAPRRWVKLAMYAADPVKG
jgi:hypothetical protein